MKKISKNAEFDYPLINKFLMNVVYETNMLKIKPRFDFVEMGHLNDVDGTRYKVTEI